LLWYPYSVNQIRARGKSRLTNATSLPIVAMVIVVQWPQPPCDGVSRFGSSG